MNALEVAELDQAKAWIAEGAPPKRVAAYALATGRHLPPSLRDALLAKVRLRKPEVGRLLADGLHGVRCRATLAAALAEHKTLGIGEAFVTPEGHMVTAQGVSLFAPDSGRHGVLSAKRELVILVVATATASVGSGNARAALDTVELELKDKQQAYHDESLALASQQRRCHDLELELLQLKQTAEAAEKRRAQVTEEISDVARQHAAEATAHAAIGGEIADMQSRLHDEGARRDAARDACNRALTAQAEGRERLRIAELAAQEAGFAELSCRDRIG